MDDKRQTSFSKQPWILPPGWRWSTLHEICELEPKAPVFGRKRMGFVPFVGFVNGPRETWSLEVTPTPVQDLPSRVRWLQQGDIVVSIDEGKWSLVEGFSETWAATHVTNMVLRPGREVEPGWIDLFLRMDEQEIIITTLPADRPTRKLTGAALGSIRIPVPSDRAYQRRALERVAPRLKELDDMQAIALEMWEDASDLRAAALLQSLDPGRIEHWNRTNLGSLSIEPPLAGTKRRISDPAGEIRYLRSGDLLGGPFEWDTLPTCRCNKLDAQRFRLFPGDVLFYGSAGGVQAFVVPAGCPPTVFGSGVIRFRPSATIHSAFLEWFSRSEEFGAQFTHAELTAATLEAAQIRLPRSVAEQRHFAAYLERVTAEAEPIEVSASQSSELVHALIEALLHQVFRGGL